MNYTAQTAYTTEKRDSRAIIYSLISYTVLIMILLFVKWSMPASPVPPFEDGIEVNLGNSEFGSGDVQPMIPGEPSASDETSYTPPKTTIRTPMHPKSTSRSIPIKATQFLINRYRIKRVSQIILP
jgi:hypothetical protein